MKKYILSAIIISAVCVLASCGDNQTSESSLSTENSVEQSMENVQQDTEQNIEAETSENIPQETKPKVEVEIDPEIGARLYGKWEAINILGEPDYKGVPAAVFNQWEFFDDGACVFFMNGVGSEEDAFSCYADGTVKIICDNQSQQVLDFVLKEDDTLTWIEDGSEMDFKKVDTLTKIDDEELQKAFE